MRTLPCAAAAALLLLGGTPAAGAGAAASLCAPTETAYFACSTAGAKVISVCGDASSGKLQYRFGRPGRIELQYPEQPSEGARLFRFAHYSRPQTDRIELRFDNATTQYALFEYFENRSHLAGVDVTLASGAERRVPCAGRVTSRLGELDGKVPCDADSALNLGSCR